MRLTTVVEKWRTINDGTRLLIESVLSLEVQLALKDWFKNANSNYVLIGGLALSYYGIPRYTQDVDVLFPTRNSIPVEVLGFKQHRLGAFQHNRTHVEVEVVSSESFTTISPQMVEAVFETSIESKDGVRIASKSGLIALKAEANRSGAKHAQDIADIVHLIELGDINLSPFPLSKEANQLIDSVCAQYKLSL